MAVSTLPAGVQATLSYNPALALLTLTIRDWRGHVVYTHTLTQSTPDVWVEVKRG
jgi:hypothetical protein